MRRADHTLAHVLVVMPAYQTINVEYFTLMDSIWYLGMLIVGGMGTCWGPYSV
ncbi:MAG: hypothetical protein SV487_04990 [Thermodesulfobacteriota bacterium]|nr:hypothetical protein [Thermodesulfobacteriota bacterium]